MSSNSRFCTKHNTAVQIHRQPGQGNVRLLVCEHTFAPGVFECDEPCAYSQGAQMGAMVGIQMTNGRPNSDGTIPLDLVRQAGFSDFTR